jgi:hypothetical protein
VRVGIHPGFGARGAGAGDSDNFGDGVLDVLPTAALVLDSPGSLVQVLYRAEAHASEAAVLAKAAAA